MRMPVLLCLASLIFSGAVYAEQDNVVPMNVKQYRELGKFGVPASKSLSIVKFNGKVFILSNMPDRRLYDITLGRTKDGREVICGKTAGSLKINNCYYVYFREK